MKGVTKQIEFPFNFTGAIKDPWGDTRFGIEAYTHINRRDYGINYGNALAAGGFDVGNEITINLQLEAVKPEPKPLLGRRRDHSRDADILGAAFDILAEKGYETMTMDMVAVRAKAGKATVYRRRASKADLFLNAVTRMKQSQVNLERLPDTGTLRGDLLALFKPYSIKEGEHKLKAMAGLASVLSQHPQFAEAGNAAIVEPWANAHRALIQRAKERGEIRSDADIETISQVIPSMAGYRALIERKPFTREFLVSLIDGVLIPALCNQPSVIKPKR